MRRQAMSKHDLRALLDRSGGCCERCAKHVVNPEDVTFAGRGERWSVQHRKPAGMGGTRDPQFNAPANVVLLCGNGTTGCHGYVEQHREVALAGGWLVRQHGDVSSEPIGLHGEGFVLLTGDWGYRRYDDGGEAEGAPEGEAYAGTHALRVVADPDGRGAEGVPALAAAAGVHGTAGSRDA